MVEGEKRDEETQLQETVDLVFSTGAFILFGLGMIRVRAWLLVCVMRVWVLACVRACVRPCVRDLLPCEFVCVCAGCGCVGAYAWNMYGVRLPVFDVSYHFQCGQVFITNFFIFSFSSFSSSSHPF